MHSKFGREEVIKNGVEAAAQACYAQRHWVKLQYYPPDRTVDHNVLPHYYVEGEVQVIRSKAEQKESETAQHHAQSTSLLTACLLFIHFLCL